jgi:hypothetical protein
MMKKPLIALLIGSAILGGLGACKKGDNDPFMSLKTRKARLTNEWELSEGLIKFRNDNSSGYYTNDYTYSNQKEVEVSHSENNGNVIDFTRTSDYTYSIKFEKDGTYVMNLYKKTNETNPITRTIETKGNWQFVLKSKEADLKKKEAVVLYPKERNETYISNGSTNVYKDSEMTDYEVEYWYIDRLASNELIIKYEYVSTSDDGYKYTESIDRTFKPKK